LENDTEKLENKLNRCHKSLKSYYHTLPLPEPIFYTILNIYTSGLFCQSVCKLLCCWKPWTL